MVTAALEYRVAIVASACGGRVAADWVLGQLRPLVLAEGLGTRWACWPEWLVADSHGGA